MQAPHHYFLGQGEQESGCREGITSFDSGRGFAQFMDSTAAEIHERESALKELGAEPMPYDPRWAIRAMVLYDKWLYDRVNCEGWYFSFRSYNGGMGLLNREISRAQSCKPEDVERECKRKVITLKSGNTLDLGKVNADYPRQIFRRAEKYASMADDEYWTLPTIERECKGCHEQKPYQR
jgi:hypothetical protein